MLALRDARSDDTLSIGGPDWSRLISAYQGPIIVTHNLETHEEKELYRSNTSVLGLSISPDGRRLAFEEPETLTAKRPSAVKTLATSGGEPRHVYSLGEEVYRLRGLQWTPDGDLLVNEQMGGKPDRLMIFPAEGGDARELELEFDLWGFTLHPDGQRVAFHVFERDGMQSQQQVWVLENFLPASTAGK